MRGNDWGKYNSILHMLDSLYDLASSMDDVDVKAKIHQAIQRATDEIVMVSE